MLKSIFNCVLFCLGERVGILICTQKILLIVGVLQKTVSRCVFSVLICMYTQIAGISCANINGCSGIPGLIWH